jgi:brefeldin A-resistance guanine nucleotide exchange factor 1
MAQEEAVSENLKNVLLVMSNGGFLAPPDEKPEQEELWNETWKRINRFLPNFFAELFPEEAQKPKAATRTSKDGKEAPEKETGKEAVKGEETKETTETKEATVEC